MHARQTIAFINRMFIAAETYGAKIPKPLATKREHLLTLDEKARHLNVNGDVPGAVVAALEAGNDPATDEGVHNAVVRRSIAEHSGSIEERVGVRALDFLQDNGDDLLGMFTETFDAAAAVLVAAVDKIGDISLTDTAAVIARGGDIAHVWADARDAQRTIREIEQIWKSYATQAPGKSINSRYGLLVIADPPADVFLSEQLEQAKLTPWDIARRGIPLSLATHDTFQDREAAVHAEVARRMDAQAGQFQKAYRARGGI